MSREKFHKIYQYVGSLRYVDIPDYNYIYNVLKDIAKDNGTDPEGPFDWEDPKNFHKLIKGWLLKVIENKSLFCIFYVLL